MKQFIFKTEVLNTGHFNTPTYICLVQSVGEMSTDLVRRLKMWRGSNPSNDRIEIKQTFLGIDRETHTDLAIKYFSRK